MVGGSRAAADDTASAGTAGTGGTGACPKQAFGLDQTQFWDSRIDSGVILGAPVRVPNHWFYSAKRSLFIEISGSIK